MNLYYRISDKGYEKTKLIGATKEVCLMNFCKSFSDIIFTDEPKMKVFCDNCDRKTTKMVASSGLPFVSTENGNAGSLRNAIDVALEENEDDEVVYFCEDDYLHLHTSPQLLEEGIKRSDYVTLYDHPDKYSRYYNGGEHSKVIKTASSHWRYTASTCMTFGVKVKTLREDRDIWFDEDLTGGDHPHDHHIFTKLGEKGRRLAVPIPGAACHTDLTFSGLVNHVNMEPWAVEMMYHVLYEEVHGDVRDEFPAKKDATPWEKLVLLDAMRLDNKKGTLS